MASGTVYELGVHYTLNGVACVNTTHIESFPLDPAEQQEAILDQWESECLTQWRATVTGDVATTHISCRIVPPPGESGALATEHDIGLVGTRGTGGDVLPPEITARATLRTSLAGRRWRGRIFVTGGLEADMGVGGWVTGLAGFLDLISSYLDTVAAAFADSAPGESGRWVVYSRQQRLETPAGVYTANVISHVERRQPSLLRSRRS